MEQVKEIGGDYRSGTTVHGGCAVLFALPFLGAGAFVIVTSTGAFGMEGMRAPPWVIAAAGAVFFLAGLWIAVHGLRGLGRRAASRARAERHPGEPWWADYGWDPREARFSALARALKSVPGFLFVCLFLSPFNYFAFLSGEMPFVAIGVVALFDLFLAIGGGVLIHGILRGLKYGSARFVFERFPFFLGGTLEGRMHSTRPIGAASIRIELRCVQEGYVTSGSGKNRSTRIVRYELHSQILDVEGGERVHEIPVTFEVPKVGDWATRLAVPPPRYWEVEFSALTPGVDYRATFMVPIYAGTSGDGQVSC